MFCLGSVALGGFCAGLTPIGWIVVGVGVTVVVGAAVVAAVVAYRRGHKAGRNKGREESEEKLTLVCISVLV